MQDYTNSRGYRQCSLQWSRRHGSHHNLDVASSSAAAQLNTDISNRIRRLRGQNRVASIKFGKINITSRANQLKIIRNSYSDAYLVHVLARTIRGRLLTGGANAYGPEQSGPVMPDCGAEQAVVSRTQSATLLLKQMLPYFQLYFPGNLISEILIGRPGPPRTACLSPNQGRAMPLHASLSSMSHTPMRFLKEPPRGPSEAAPWPPSAAPEGNGPRSPSW